jgi:hypothetical protein
MFPGAAFIPRSKTILALWLPRCNGTGGRSVTRHGGQARDPSAPLGASRIRTLIGFEERSFDSLRSLRINILVGCLVNNKTPTPLCFS